MQTDLKVGIFNGQPTLFVDEEQISVRKSLVGLQKVYIREIEEYMDACIEQT